MKNKNEYKYYLQSALWYVVTMMISGSVIQACMLEIGIDSKHVSFFVSAMQVIQVVVMLTISKHIERIKNVIKVYFFTSLIPSLLLGVMLFMCYENKININVKFYTIFIAGMIANIAIAIYNIITYKIPFHILDMNRYGLISGVSGIIGGLVGIIFSAVLAFFLERYKYIPVIKGFYVVTIIFIILSALIIINFKDNGYKSNSDNNYKINLFKYKPFTVLFIPDFLRGINTGTILLMLTIGYHIKIIDSVSSGYLVVITNASMILSCIFYSYISKFKNDKLIILISSCIIMIFMPLMCIGKSTLIFLSTYAIVYFVFILINCSVPVLLTKIVRYEIIGQYSAMRMLLHTLGGAIAGVIYIPMIDLLGTFPTLTIMGLMQFISGVTYFIYASKTKEINVY